MKRAEQQRGQRSADADTQERGARLLGTASQATAGMVMPKHSATPQPCRHRQPPSHLMRSLVVVAGGHEQALRLLGDAQVDVHLGQKGRRWKGKITR